MNKFSKILCTICIFSMLFMQVAVADEITTTNANVQLPSSWAAWDIQMANTYGLGIEETYTNYDTEIVGNDFATIEKSFEERFDIDYESKLEPEKVVTRGDIIEELYNIINLSINSDDDKNALEYFAHNSLINGRVTGNYGLDQVCTNEEMLVFAKRAYDHIVYSLGQEVKGCFWKVSDSDNTVYLLGSIHVSDGSLYPLSKDILNAFQNSQTIAVEANTLSQKPEEIQYAQQLMFYTNDETIDKHISKETYDEYASYMKKIGVPKDTYDRLKPWAATLTIQNLQLTSADISGAMGIDMYFLALATGRMPIIEIEGSKYQYDMFDSFSDELQESQLLQVLTAEPADEENTTQSVELTKSLLECWKTADTEQLEEILFSTEPTTNIEKEYNKKLFDDRNENMTEFVIKALKEDDKNNYFVVVGAGHMLNNTGIVELLEKVGYTVEQIR